jgi:hypothetical protein
VFKGGYFNLKRNTVHIAIASSSIFSPIVSFTRVTTAPWGVEAHAVLIDSCETKVVSEWYCFTGCWRRAARARF